MRYLTLIVLAVVTLSGCASLSKTPEERVLQRAGEFLDLLLEGSMEEAFEYVTPGRRQTMTWQRFAANYAGVVNWNDGRVHGAQCDGSQCIVSLSVDYMMVRPRLENTRAMEHTWLEVDGEWYFYPK